MLSRNILEREFLLSRPYCHASLEANEEITNEWRLRPFSRFFVFFSHPERSDEEKRAKSELDGSELKNADDLRLLNFHISLKIYAVCCRENKVSIKIQLF